MNMYKIKDHPNLSFKLINRVTGWVTFVIASMTYILTAESTASLWDCGEFITTSVGLQVGHPPGAPLFMIISRLFAIFAPSADTQAYMINCMSAICSGLTILFLFWSITHLARKLIVKEGEEMTMGQMFAILGASLIGSLTYTFTDTFWFSAVEGEVYAMSSLFLGYPEMGKCRFRTLCQPLADPDRLPDRTVYRSTLIELAGNPGNRVCLLFQKIYTHRTGIYQNRHSFGIYPGCS